ncbi:MAG: hypothetical protein R3Y59_10770 [bacterium]
MDNIGDIIYVVVIIVAALSSGIKSLLKRAEQNRSTVVPDPAESVTETGNIKEEDFYQPQPQSQQRALNYHELSTYMTDEEIKVEYPQIYQQHITEMRQREKLAEMQRVRQRATSNISKRVMADSDTRLNDVSENLESEIDFTDESEVRKAFIASEIFNRKY